jgi:hypothetical protein
MSSCAMLGGSGVEYFPETKTSYQLMLLSGAYDQIQGSDLRSPTTTLI